MYTHKSCFRKTHTYARWWHMIFFRAPPCLLSFSLSLSFFLSLSLCLHFLSFALLNSLLTLSTHSSFCKLALLFVFKSAVALPDTLARKRTHCEKHGMATCNLSLFSAVSSFSLSNIFLAAPSLTVFPSSRFPRHGASDLPPTWPAPGTDVLFLERSLTFSLFLLCPR